MGSAYSLLMVLKVIGDHCVSGPFLLSPGSSKALGSCVCWMGWICNTHRTFLTNNWTIKSDMTVNGAKRSKSRRKHWDVIRAQILKRKKKFRRFSQPCSWRAAHGSEEQAGCCSAKPSAVQHLFCQLMLRNNLFQGSHRGCSILRLHYRSPWPGILHIHSMMCGKP